MKAKILGTPLYIFISILLSNFIPVFAAANNNPDKADEVINLTYNCGFNGALKIIRDNLSANNNSLQWNYFEGMVLFKKSIYVRVTAGTNEEKKISDELYSQSINSFNRVIKAGEKILAQNPNDTLALFFTGAAYDYIGMYYTKKDELYTAAEEGKKGLDLHARLLKLCPRWYDVYLSEGLFNLYASDIPWYLKPVLWILGRSGDEDKAVKLLKLVAERGSWARYEAMEALLKYYLWKNDESMVNATYRNLINDFPGSRYFYSMVISSEALKTEGYTKAISFIYNEMDYYKKRSLTQSEKKQFGQLYIISANYHLNNYKYQKAADLWKELISKKLLVEDEAWLWLSLGDIYKQNNNKTEAANAYKYVLENYPSEKDAAQKRLQKLR